MSDFIDRLFGRNRKSSSQAKERLKFVLIHDRTNLTPDALDKMKDELLTVISKYVEIDPTMMDIQMQQDGREQRLIADIPIKPVGRRRSRSI